MPIKPKKHKYHGILAALDWNSNKWQGPSTQDDLLNSAFGFVIKNGITYTSLNFAHEIYGQDKEELHSGLVPHFFTREPDPDKFKDVQIIFFRSKDWNSGKTYIIGFYAFPSIIKSQKTILLENTELLLDTNIQALVKDIHLITNYIDLSEYSEIKKLLPEDKKLGKRGYNYLTRSNVERILDVMKKLNPSDKRLEGIMLRLLTTFEKINYRE